MVVSKEKHLRSKFLNKQVISLPNSALYIQKKRWSRLAHAAAVLLAVLVGCCVYLFRIEEGEEAFDYYNGYVYVYKYEEIYVDVGVLEVVAVVSS